MKIISISDRAAAILLERVEWNEEAQPGELSILARHSLSCTGIDPRGKIEIRIFETDDRVMLLIRKLTRRVYAFDSFEQLLTALRESDITTDIIYYVNRWYILSEDDVTFAEYGSPVHMDDCEEGLLKEHGSTVLQHGKADEFCAYFV